LSQDGAWRPHRAHPQQASGNHGEDALRVAIDSHWKNLLRLLESRPPADTVQTDMEPDATASQFRFEKRRADAVVTVTGAEPVRGCFFTVAGTTHDPSGERIGDLLNAESGFLPFEMQTESKPRTMLLNRAHVITVEIFDDEARRDPGYAVATR